MHKHTTLTLHSESHIRMETINSPNVISNDYTNLLDKFTGIGLSTKAYCCYMRFHKALRKYGALYKEVFAMLSRPVPPVYCAV